LADVVVKVAFADTQAIEDTAAQLDLEVLSTVADRISAARRVASTASARAASSPSTSDRSCTASGMPSSPGSTRTSV